MSLRSNPRLVNQLTDKIFEITSDMVAVGRSLKADLVVIGQSISRIHFTVAKKNDLWIIQDHSTNGTRINNILLKSASTVLTSGDVINFLEDSVSFKFEMPSTQEPTRNREPNSVDSDFIVSRTNGNVTPSVSNDHNYQKPSRLTLADIPIDLTSPSSSRVSKRKKPMTEEVPPKKLAKNPHCILEPSELECSICQELYIKPTTLNCSHSFCTFCIYRWKSQRNHCPICRKQIDSINPSIVLDNFVTKLVDTLDNEAKAQREKMIEERNKDSVKPPSAPASISDSMEVVDLSDDEDSYDDDDDDSYYNHHDAYGMNFIFEDDEDDMGWEYLSEIMF